MQRSIGVRLLYVVRNIRARKLFRALSRYCKGNVLDVGGWGFYETAKAHGIGFETWTTLEYSEARRLDLGDENFFCVIGDGCRMEFEDGRFDTVLSIQVVEHVFEPVRMIQELSRVLKRDGYGIFLIPQTASLHSVPDIYYNFTRFWIRTAVAEAGLEVIELEPMGGVWSSTASRLFYFFLQSVRYRQFSTPECRRNPAFYVLYPFMVVYAALSIPICLLLSLGDLTEEPNNHLVVVRKP